MEAGGVFADIVQHAGRVCVLMKGGIQWARGLRNAFCDSCNLTQVLCQRLPAGIRVGFFQAAEIGVSPKGTAAGVRGPGDRD